MITLYRIATKLSAPLLRSLLHNRAQKGKEVPARLSERMGITDKERPQKALIWLHAASVGEAQSALILVNYLLSKIPDLHIMVTTGTVTSAQLMKDKLPERAFHQFYPLDHPDWVRRFLDHWQPNFVFWMESELWPNMLGEIQKRHMPAVLVNARLSDKSYKGWMRFKSAAKTLISSFSLILTQTPLDEERYNALGAMDIFTTGNIKYNAAPLQADENDLKTLQTAIKERHIWVFASTHKGEEEMACRIHDVLKNNIPDILTIIVPRHPDRRNEILQNCKNFKLNMQLRGEDKAPPSSNTDIYIADTLGELGLFYALAPVACIGRSFSDDGGGGHNPIEAAQLGCAVLYGPHVQFQQEIYNDMQDANAALRMPDEHRMSDTLHKLLTKPDILHDQQERGRVFATEKATVLDRIVERIEPLLKQNNVL